MAFDPIIGTAMRMGIGDSLPVTVELDFQNPVGLAKNYQYVDFSGIRGSRSRPSNRVRSIGGVPGGSFTCRPTPIALAALLKYIRTTVTAGSPDTFGFAEALTAFAITVQTGAKKHDWTGCKVNRAEFSASKGSALMLTTDVMATAYACATASFPSISIDETTKPWIHEDSKGGANSAFSVNGTTVDVFDVSLTIDHVLVARQVNALAPTGLYPTDHIVEWNITIPYDTDTLALYELTEAGVAVAWALHGPTYTLRFTSPKVAFQPVTPTAQDREEMRLPLRGQARWSSAAGDELVVALDLNGSF